MESNKSIFVPHALERMHKREVSREQVIEAIRNPDSVYPGKEGVNRKMILKDFGGRVVKVVYAERPEGILVITATWKGE